MTSSNHKEEKPVSRTNQNTKVQRDNLFISVITPTFNRRNKVVQSIYSSLAWLQEITEGEIIIVDDGSTDGTAEHLRQEFPIELKTGKIRYFKLEQNKGVTGAKQYGVAQAQGEWLIFLDSDDQLVIDSRDDFIDLLKESDDTGLIFFRCLDMDTHELVGIETSSISQPDCHEMLMKWHYGECLPVTRREVSLKFPYDEDLRGSEGIAYYRMTANNVKALVAHFPARLLDRSGEDRLSTRNGLDRRARLKMLTHWRIFSEFRKELGAIGTLTTAARIGVWAFRHIRFILLRRK